MVKSSRHRNSRAARAEVNRYWCGSIGVGSVAQLSIVAVSHTLQIAVVKDDTRVVLSSSHRNGRSARAEVDRIAWLVVGDAWRWARAKLVLVIVSPALEITVVENGTGVTFACIYRNGRSTRAKVDRGS